MTPGGDDEGLRHQLVSEPFVLTQRNSVGSQRLDSARDEILDGLTSLVVEVLHWR